MVPASVRPGRWKNKERKKNMAPTSTSVPGEREQIPAPPTLIIVSPPHITRVLFKLLPLPWDSECNLGFLQFFDSPRHKPQWFSKLDAKGLPFPVQCRSPGLGLGPIPLWRGGNLGCDILPAVGHHMGCQGRVGPDWIEPTPPTHLGVVFSISLVVGNLLVFRSFSESCCV